MKSTTPSTPKISRPEPRGPKLSEAARHLIIPEGIVTSVFPRVERRLNVAGIGFDNWQRGLGSIALGCREDGKYAATVGGVCGSITRQTGKTFSVGRLLVGLSLEFPGYKTAWTSHHNRTTQNTFRSISALVRHKSIYPLLDHTARSDGIRTSNGQQEIAFANGSLMAFGAREYGFGRGFDELDCEVFDEAQILTLAALEDMIPAVNQARHEHGGLLFFLGTPPRPKDPGEAFTAKRAQALDGHDDSKRIRLTHGDVAYIEFSADRGSDLDDPAQYPIMNPSFPHRTPVESIKRMRANIPDDDSWNREARGVWPEVSQHLPVVKLGVWRGLKARGPELDVVPSGLGVDMSHGGEISVDACWIDDIGSAHVEEIWAGTDVAAAIDWIATAAGRRIEVVIDDLSPAAQMIPALTARRVKVRRGSARDMGKGCLMFETRANAEPATLTHGNQKQVTDAVMGGRKRPISDAGGWGWDRRDSTVKIHQAVGVSLALLAATTTHKPAKAGRTSSGRQGVVL